MRISTKAGIAATLMFGTMLLISISIAWALLRVQDALEERRQSALVASALKDMRMVTLEYLLNRRPRARLQEQIVWDRLEQLFATPGNIGEATARSLADLRAQADASHRLFSEVGPTRETAGGDEVQQRFEAQLSNRLLILQQQSQLDATRLIDQAATRIDATQRHVVSLIAGGLVLMAVVTALAAWLFRRDVLMPIGRLENATREVAAGNWAFTLDVGRQDELGEMARHFDAMTRALRESFGQLELSNRELAVLNKELESFSYSVSHDLRGPLRSMDGFSLALLEDYEDKLDAEAQDYLHRIRGASQRMGRLIDDLLNLARVTRAELRLQPVDLSALVKEMAATLQRAHPERRVRWEIEDGMAVRADSAQIQIALQNLVDNAWKFTGKTDQAVIRVGTQNDAHGPVFFVSDNGAGFDMAYVDRLFGAFQRLHHETDFPGTGIGLAIVQRVFRRHGWPLWAQSSPGQGASFFFRPMEPPDERREQSHSAG